MLRKMLQHKKLVFRLGRVTVSCGQVTGPAEEGVWKSLPHGENEKLLI